MGTPTASKSNQRAQPFARWRADATALIDEITTAAACIASARTPTGQPVARSDGVWRVLKAVERSPYCLAIADLARVLKVRPRLVYVAHVLRVVRQRLEWDARAMARRGAIR